MLSRAAALSSLSIGCAHITSNHLRDTKGLSVIPPSKVSPDALEGGEWKSGVGAAMLLFIDIIPCIHTHTHTHTHTYTHTCSKYTTGEIFDLSVWMLMGITLNYRNG